jgi:hypothetical protein
MGWAIRAAVVLLALLAAFAPVDRTLVERWYSTSIYPSFQRVLTPVSNLVPFAWFDLLGVAAVALFVAMAASPAHRGRTPRRTAARRRRSGSCPRAG